MHNVKVVILSPSTEVLDNSWETNYSQALEQENTLIQKKWTNKNKYEEKFTKNVITKNYITQSL
jgi:hypothetical protein